MTIPDSDISVGTCPIEPFAAQVAHDFNNLLTGILGNLELLQACARRRGVKDFDVYLEGARHAGDRAARLTQRLFAFSGQGAQDAAQVDLDAMIRGVIAPMRADGSAIATELAAGARVFCEAGQAELALQELLDNAAQAAGAGGHIVVRTEITGTQAVISVTDDGPGMAPEVLRHATEPFFSTRACGAGQGLGLAIVEGFARRSGGVLELSSAQGQGTTARLRLPAGRP
jgi:signal transduction histidine kinase